MSVIWSKCVSVCMCSTGYSCHILIKLIFSAGFRKILNYKVSWKLSIGSWVASCGQTNRHDEANSRLSQVCERAGHWLCAVPCLCLHLVVAAVATGSDCLVMSSSGAEDKPWKLIVKSHTPSFSRLFKIAICESGWARSLRKIGMLCCVRL